MKKLLLFLVANVMAINIVFSQSQGAAINTTGNTADPSALLDVSSHSQGVLIPRMTTAERNAITSPAEGLQIFNTTTKCFEFYANGFWQTSTCSCTPVAASVSIAAVPSGAICSGTSITFTATPTNGGTLPTYQWNKGGLVISGATNSTYTSTTLANSDAISCVMASNANCATGSPTTSNIITISLYSIPTITATSPASRNGAGTVTLGATASAGTINWYTTATSGSSFGTGSTFTTPNICTTTTFYVDATANGCTTSSRTSVTATINNVFQVDNGCSLSTNLLSYWKMEGNSTDFYGSNSGTDASMSYSSGKINQGANFNGSNSNITVNGSSLNLNQSSPFTVSMWFYLPTLFSDWKCMIEKQENVSNEWNYVLAINSSNQLVGSVSVQNVNFLDLTSVALTAGTWYMGTLTWSGSLSGINTYLYLNGNQVSSGSFAIFGNKSIATLYFGKLYNSTSYFKGYIDEVGIWSRVLSTTEIQDLYNSGIGQTMQ